MNTNAQNYNPWLHRFILATAAATFLLLGSGGMVTSHEAGMSVPDWPNTYGYNMFLFPISKWVGGIFYEHTHRLLASGIGLLTAVLAVWLWRKDARPWMRWLGVLAFVLVALQGVLGGLRVTLDMDKLGIVHGALAQLFFVLTCALALFTGRWWQNSGRDALPRAPNFPNEAAPQRGSTDTNLRWLVLFTTLLILGQLILGATMRHQHAGLAIPDFPAAYGKIWPDTSTAAVALYNEHRMSVMAESPITAFQIMLQMVHRMVALAIFVMVAVCAWRAHRWSSRLSVSESSLKVELQLARHLSLFWLVLIVGQIALGAATIWSNKAADVATAHVLIGALALVTGALWCAVAFRESVAAAYDRRTKDRRAQTAAPIGVHPSMVGNK